MKKQLPESSYSLLNDISRTAAHTGKPVYLIGGIVRDLFLERPNDDIDIVVEGNGIDFANHLQADYGGSVKVHENFGTATWNHPSKLSIDVTSARLEYYDRPASLPDVELSTLNEDLYRRDFTINSMALCLNPEIFGDLVDPFNGQSDLRSKTIKVLHNLSFIDDPTRILRAVRFETRFNFSMDKQTESLALNSIGRMKDLSAHRIVEEMKRLFKDQHPPETIKRLFKLNFWQQFGVSGDSADQSHVHANQLQIFYSAHKALDAGTVRWFNYFAIPFFSDNKMHLMHQFSLTKENNKFLQDIRNLSDMEDVDQTKTIGDFHRFLKNYTDEAIIFMVARENMKNEEMIISYLKKREDMPALLTGEDLINQGMKPGAHFKNILLDLEVAVLNEEIKTQEDALNWLHKNHIS